MDRFSIIQRQVFNQVVMDETSNCGQDQCVCDDNIGNENQKLKKTNLFQFSIITIAAFITAFIMKANMTLENIRSPGKTTVILCSPKNDHSDNKLPADNNNNNSCFHQQSALSETNNSKRKSFKFHNCSLKIQNKKIKILDTKTKNKSSLIKKQFYQRLNLK